jgi:hypothetical protein
MSLTIDQGAVLTFNIEGQEVRCFQNDQDRLWRCECEYFQRTLTQYNQGFCPHVAVAIWRAAEDGFIDMGGL